MKRQVERLQSLSSKNTIWVNTTGNGIAVCDILDELGIPYLPITVLAGKGSGEPLCVDCDEPVFRLNRTDDGVSLELTNARHHSA